MLLKCCFFICLLTISFSCSVGTYAGESSKKTNFKISKVCDDRKGIIDGYITSNVNYKYKNGENTYEIFDWIDSCQNIENKITGYSALFKAIVNNKQDNINGWTLKFAITLAEKYQPLINDGSGVKLPEKYYKELFDLYEKIPTCVMNIVANAEVFVKNVKYEEYLFASDIKERGDASKRNVFFKNLTTTYGDSKWDPKTIEKDDGMFFVLKNSRYGETLFVSGLKNSFGDHILYTSFLRIYRDITLWILEPADETGSSCYLKNLQWNEYLCTYEETFDSQRRYRRVFTMPETSADYACHFTFDF